MLYNICYTKIHYNASENDRENHNNVGGKAHHSKLPAKRRNLKQQQRDTYAGACTEKDQPIGDPQTKYFG